MIIWHCRYSLFLVQVPNLMQQGLLADFIVARQLFALWLPDLCEAGTPAHKLYQSITDQAWEAHSLLTVIGYFAAQEVTCNFVTVTICGLTPKALTSVLTMPNM